MSDEDGAPYEQDPPHDYGAERQVLGAMLSDDRAREEVTAILTTGWEFYKPFHEQVWRAVIAVAAAGPVDVSRVVTWMRERHGIGRTDAAALFDLYAGLISPANAAWHAETVARRAAQRALIEAGKRVMQRGYQDTDDIVETQEAARAEIDRATGATATTGQATWVSDDVHDTLASLEDPAELWSTGWADLDHVIGGLASGRLYVVGARPGVGKSVFGLQAGAWHARRHQRAVLFASLEMSKRELHLRLLSQAAKVPFTNLERHQLTDDDWTRISQSNQKISETPLSIMDRPDVSISGIRREARTISRTHELGLIVVDYLQLMSGPPRQARHETVAEFSRSLKLLSKELGVPVLAMSQLNRASEHRSDKRPSLADLRESGAVEQDADVVLLLHRDLQDEAEADTLEMSISKNRHGSVGAIDFLFEGHYQRITEKAWKGAQQ